MKYTQFYLFILMIFAVKHNLKCKKLRQTMFLLGITLCKWQHVYAMPDERK